MMYAMASVGEREMPARQCTNARLLDSRTLSAHSTRHAVRDTKYLFFSWDFNSDVRKFRTPYSDSDYRPKIRL